MSMISFAITKSQTCKSCGQRTGKGGHWEPIGVMNGPVWMCTKCGCGVRMGFLFDKFLPKEFIDMMLQYRNEKMNDNIL